MKTNYVSTIILVFIFSFSTYAQTEFKKDSIHLFQWNNNTSDWLFNTREYLTYDNGGVKETNLRRESLNGSNWVNFYQFNKAYNGNGNIEENIRQNWNGSSWDNSAKYDHGYDTNQNETDYLYSFFTSGNWLGYQREIKSYTGSNLDIKTMEQYDFTFMEFVPEEQFLYTYAGNLLDYEIKRIYFPDVAAWENAERLDYTYNASNLLTDIERFGFNSSTGEFTDIASPKTTQTHTAEGLIEERVTQVWATSEYLNTERIAYTYLNGNQIELLIQNWNSANSEWENLSRQVRVFDTDNNEIELIFESWDTSTDTWKGFLRYLNYWSPSETLSVSEFNKNTSITVYPNPSTDYITINSNHAITNLELYNLLGKQVLQTTKTLEIDISNLEAGIYLLKISNQNKVTTKKIIIH